MKYKTSGTLLLFLIALLTFTGIAQAAPEYEIKKVLVDNLDITGSSFDVKRDSDVLIEVWIEGTGNETIPDVRAEAKVLGYEFGVISDLTNIFAIEGGRLYKKTLRLHIPKDIDASEEYTLRIEVSDKKEEIKKELNFHIDEQRHSLNIFDIVLNPSSRIQAGQALFPSVVVENLGAMKEENIKVTVSVPELGITAVNYLDELITQRQEERRTFNLREESSERIDFLLRVPEDTKTGEYTLKIEVLYNRGHSVLSSTRTFAVQGVETKEVDTVINIDSTSKSTEAGKEVIYKVMFANLGTERGIYSVQVDGVSWAQHRVEPGFVTVAPDATAEALIYITPNSNVEAKNYVSVVRVMLGREIINEFTLNTNVQSATEEQATTSALKTTLAVVFSVLVIALIILGLVIAFRKIGKSDEDEPVTNIPEGQTYYYHPRR
tara:strand:- start:10325 stop:11629 length:1305 start_codon:yes stop_codon:yes gene_type:complete